MITTSFVNKGTARKYINSFNLCWGKIFIVDIKTLKIDFLHNICNIAAIFQKSFAKIIFEIFQLNYKNCIAKNARASTETAYILTMDFSFFCKIQSHYCDGYAYKLNNAR